MRRVTDRKGILKEETVKIIIAVISILILIYLAYSLYKITAGSKQKQQAEAILKQVEDKINLLKDKGSMVLAGPKGWFLETRDNQRLCVVCNEKKYGVCPRGYNLNSPTCISIKEGTSVQIPAETEIYITEINLEKTIEGANAKIIISLKK